MIVLEEVDPIAALYGDLASVKTLNDVINISIAFDRPVKTQMGYGDDKEYYETLGFYSEEREKKYGQHGGVFSFFYKGIHYEVFATDQVEKILQENGFVFEPSIGTILSGGVVPTDFQEFWHKKGLEKYYIKQNNLLTERKKALKHSISNAGCDHISDDLILTRCFKVPADGYKYVVENSDSKEPMHRKPITDEMNEGLTVRKMLNLVGKMSKSISGGGYSGQCTFVYLDGNVYVTKSEEVIRELKKHGFVESDEVPNLGLGWYQKMIDPYCADRYERVMISDEEYHLIEQKTSEERRIGYLEEQNKSLRSAHKQFIESLAHSYHNYCDKAKSQGVEIVTLEEFVITILGLDISPDIIIEIESINKVF